MHSSVCETPKCADWRCAGDLQRDVNLSVVVYIVYILWMVAKSCTTLDG